MDYEWWKSLSRVRLLRHHRLYSPWNSPGQNTGVGSLSLLQGIFPTQELNRGLLHCRQILYQLSYQENPEERWGEPNILLEKSCFSEWEEAQHNLELKGPQLHENIPRYLSLNFQGPILSQSKSQLTQKTLRDWAFNLSCYSAIYKLRLCGCLFSEISVLQLQEISGFFCNNNKSFLEIWSPKLITFFLFLFPYIYKQPLNSISLPIFIKCFMEANTWSPKDLPSMHIWSQVTTGSHFINCFPLHAVNYHCFLHHWRQDYYVSISNPKSLQMVIAAMKLKDAYSLEGKLWPT